MGRLVIALVVLGMSVISLYAQDSKFKTVDRPIPNRYIVVLNENAAGGLGENSRSEELSKGLATVYGGKVDSIFRYALSGYSIEMSIKQARRLSQDPKVKFVEQDGFVFANQSSVPWGVDRIDQRNLPLDGINNAVGTGLGVNAYIIDTGIRVTHGEFGGRASIAYDAVGDGQNGNDCNGHGTAVAGIVGGSTYGVAKEVSLRAVRVIGCSGTGSTSDLIDGIDWVTEHRASPAVANISIGGDYNQSLDDAIRGSILYSGVTYVIAAGNDNDNACNHSPARVDLAITVGATDINDVRLPYSNYGPCLDIFAPTNVPSAYHTSDTATATIGGTSAASPHVAGVAALYLSSSLSWDEVSNIIVSDATANVVTDVGPGSPNRLLHSRLGTLSSSGGGCLGNPGTYSYHPNTSGFNAGGGEFVADSTSGAWATNLALEKFNGLSWSRVAAFYNSGYPPTHNPHLEYIGTPGTYRWALFSYSGTGCYTIYTLYPAP